MIRGVVLLALLLLLPGGAQAYIEPPALEAHVAARSEMRGREVQDRSPAQAEKQDERRPSRTESGRRLTANRAGPAKDQEQN